MSRTFAVFSVLLGSVIGSVALAADDDSCLMCRESRVADAASFQKMLNKLFPDAQVEVVPGPNESWTIAGTVAAPGQVSPIMELASKACPNAINGLRVDGPQQVQLRVFMAEITRDKLKEMGFHFESARGAGDPRDRTGDSHRLGNGTHVPAGFTYSPESSLAWGRAKNADELRGFIRALTQEGAAKVIAEPTLVTYSGHPASMICGGEFPIIVPGQQGTFSVEFREYGTRIDVLPITLGRGRIRLEFRPEFSQLDYANGVTMSGFVIPGIQQRRIETAVEMNSGETFVCGGLYSSSVAPPRLPMMAPRLELPACAAIDAVLSCLAPCPPRVYNIACAKAAQAVHACHQVEKELIVMISAELIEPSQSTLESTSDGDQTDVVLAAAETDAVQPHPPAVLLKEVAPCPSTSTACERPTVWNLGVRVQKAMPDCIRFFHDNDAIDLVCEESRQCESGRGRTACCQSDSCKWETTSACCRERVDFRRADMDEDDEDGADEAEGSLVEHVLQSQAQFFDTMMQMRLNHERAMFEAKAAAEIALAKKDAEHAQVLMRLQTQHMTELMKVKEAGCEVERRMLEAQHRQALEHQRELAALRRDHQQESQMQRLTSLDSDVRELRSQLATGQPASAAHVTVVPGRIESHRGTPAARVIGPGITVHVEDLESGRVRYGAVKPAGPQPAVTHDAVEPVEFSMPPLSAGRRQQDDVTDLRREVARLRTLIEEMLCITADSPPTPVPHRTGDEDSDR